MNNKPHYCNKGTLWYSTVLLLLLLISSGLNAQGIKMTSFAFGGTGVMLSKVYDQKAIMTGGRGSATFNNRYTFGGAGWGMLKGVEVESYEAGVHNFFKFGYGGLEFGYILFPGEKFRLGSNLLLAYGVGFNETVPKSSGGDFNMFPIGEPSVYFQIPLGKFLKLDAGISFRYVTGSDFAYLNNKELSGFSFYIALLTGTCRCE